MPSESRTVIASAVVVTRASYVRRVNASVSPDACKRNSKNSRGVTGEILHYYNENEHTIPSCADSKCARACHCSVDDSAVDEGTSTPAIPL